MNYEELRAELDAGHPDTGPYSSNDAQAADELNAVNRTVTVQRVPGSDIFNQTDDVEYAALLEEDKNRWLAVCAVLAVDVASGVARAEEAAIFGPGTTTRSNLAALKTQPASRAVEIDLGYVRAGDVTYARGLP